MSTVQFFALLLCGICLAALLIGLVRPSWVLPLRRATRVKVLLLYSAAGVMVLLVAGALPDRSAHAQITDALPVAAGQPAGAADAEHRPGLSEEEPAPESLRALASRFLLDLGFGAGHRLRAGRLNVIYEDPVTSEQAAALGEFLSRAELGAISASGNALGGDSGPSAGPSQDQVQVYLRQTSAGAGLAAASAYELRIATPFSRREQLDPETKAAYQLVGLIASGLAFDGAPVFVHVCTAFLRPLVVLRPQLGS